MNTTRTSLSESTSPDLQEKILRAFWRKPRSGSLVENYAPYFQFYDRSCEALYLGIRSEAASLIADSHEHVLDIVEMIWGDIDRKEHCLRLALRKKLAERFQLTMSEKTRRGLDNSINLALRLWLTIDIREDTFAPAASTVQWDETATLQEFIQQQFRAPRLSSTSEKERTILGGDFTAVNLRRFGGINIDWTYNLNEHLLFNRECRRLKVYTLKTCLYDHKNRCVNFCL